MEENLTVKTCPLVTGVVPSKSTIDNIIFYQVKTKEGHILTEKEWSDVVFDNAVVMGKQRKQKGICNIKDLVFDKINT